MTKLPPLTNSVALSLQDNLPLVNVCSTIRFTLNLKYKECPLAAFVAGVIRIREAIAYTPLT